jgi:hypothetical protein
MNDLQKAALYSSMLAYNQVDVDKVSQAERSVVRHQEEGKRN